MNDIDLQSSPPLGALLSPLSDLAAGRRSTGWSADRASALAALLPPAPELPSDVIAPATRPAGLAWHSEQLLGLCRPGAEAASPAGEARRRFHARMLGHGLAPEREEFRPLVTILIPVFNRCGPVVEAVQSCLAQAWQPIEILVIDDGSTDDPAAALAPFGAAVRLHRKPNGGVASARNLGISLATGDFVHFLDSDDLLLPRAIESKLAAFRAVTDAELCYGQSRWIDMRVSPPALRELRQHVIENPARSMVVAFPFLLQAVMMPRWRLLAAAPFEEDLRRSSDFRYWQCLGLAGVKVVGSRVLSTHLRRFHDSLHLTPEHQDDSHAVALMRGLRDMALHPQAWRHGVEYLDIVAAKRAQYWLGAARSDRVRTAATEAIAALERAAQGRPSPLPMFAAMRARRRRLKKRGDWPDQDPRSIYRMLTDAIDRSLATARRLSDGDVSFWSSQSDAPPGGDPTFGRFFAAIEAHCSQRRRASLADTLLRAMPRIPSRRIVRRAAALQRLLGASLAVAIVKRAMKHKQR